jgi:hypothetical protein
MGKAICVANSSLQQLLWLIVPDNELLGALIALDTLKEDVIPGHCYCGVSAASRTSKPTFDELRRF